MSKMTEQQIQEHRKNPNIIIRKEDSSLFRCECGCNVFHHIDDDEIYICNSCKMEYISKTYVETVKDTYGLL